MLPNITRLQRQPHPENGFDLRRIQSNGDSHQRAENSTLDSPVAERAVLGCILLSPKECLREMIALFNGDSSIFYDLRHRQIYDLLIEMYRCDEPIDTVTVQQRLKDHNLLDAIGGVSYLASLPDTAPSASSLDYYIPIIRDKYIRREIHTFSIELQTSIHGARSIDDIVARAKASLGLIYEDTAVGKLRKILAQCAFDLKKLPSEARAVYQLCEVPICTRGNITTIAAAPKVGKTALIGAMAAAVLTNSKVDTFGVFSRNESGYALVHFDTEQSPEHHWHQTVRVIKRAGVEHKPEWFISYSLAHRSPLERQELIRQALADAKDQCGGIHSILIDGVADNVLDVNDAGECCAYVGELHAQAIRFNAPIVCVIHMNPKSDKSRGHLGSQLERKAESNLILEKDGDATLVWAHKQRGAPIPKAYGPRFKWSDDAGMHVSCSERQCDKSDKCRQEVEGVFKDGSPMLYSDLLKAIKTTLNVSQSTAERRFASYRNLKLIKKDIGTLWERAA